jgi:ferrous iron transport protein A
MLLLGLLHSGEQAEVMEIRPQRPGDRLDDGLAYEDRQSRLENMGIRVGKKVQMLSSGGGGPLLIKVDESRIALSRGVAMKILVRRITI